MSNWVWFSVAGMAVALLGIGVIAGWLLSDPVSHHVDRISVLTGTFFAILGISVTGHAVWTEATMHRHIMCNMALLEVLQTRADARLTVDHSTAAAQSSLAAVLDDLDERNDVELEAARRAFAQAALDRGNPALALPYPDCR